MERRAQRLAAALTACLALMAGALLLGATASGAVPAGGLLTGPAATHPARAVAQAPGVGAGAYQWPLDGPPTVARRFDPPPQRWLPGHRGVDLVGEPGMVVRAAGAGAVHYAGLVAGVGVVSITHVDGLRTTYQPVTPAVAAGDRVAAGDPIGVLEPGHAGCPAPACLHWGLRQGDHYLDPLSLLGFGQLRLLPRHAAV